MTQNLHTIVRGRPFVTVSIALVAPLWCSSSDTSVMNENIRRNWYDEQQAMRAASLSSISPVRFYSMKSIVLFIRSHGNKIWAAIACPPATCRSPPSLVRRGHSALTLMLVVLSMPRSMPQPGQGWSELLSHDEASV